jgi:hypothetical protein
LVFQVTGIVVLPDGGAQALNHAQDTRQMYVYDRYWAFSSY